jgi:hypothetical protein
MGTTTRRALLRAALAAAALLAWAGSAGAQSIPVRLYPVDGGKLTADQTADCQALLEAGLMRGASRFDALVPAEPLGVRAACGRRNPGPACLAKLAGDGILIAASARDRGVDIVFTLIAVDQSGREYGPVRATTDATVTNAVPIGDAILELDRRVSGRAKTPDALRVANAATLLNDLPPPRKVVVSYKDSKPEPWQRPAGKMLTAGGLAVLGAGAAFGVMGHKLSADLDAKYDSGTLTGEDAGSYARVDRYGAAANVLMITGGVATAAGITLWTLSPDVVPEQGGATIRLKGKF